MTGLLYLTFLVMVQCGHATENIISQLNSTLRVQPGFSTSLTCRVQLYGHFYIFWIKNPLNQAPVSIATFKSSVNTVVMGEQFKNRSRIKATWNQRTFTLSLSSVEQADVGTYLCALFSYEKLYLGNGSKLILEEHADVSPNTTAKVSEDKDGNMLRCEYLVPTLVTTNVVSVLFIILLIHLLRKNKSGVTGEVSGAGDNKADEVNYAALTFGNKQRRTVQMRTSVDSTVVYGSVRHQEEL